MAVLEGLDFKHFRGSIPPDPPSLRMPVVISPPISEPALCNPCTPTNLIFLKPTLSMRHRTYSTWKIKFLSKAQYFWSAHSARYTCLWSKNAGNGGFGRSRFQNFPPRGLRLPALGPLFTNFLDTPLMTVQMLVSHWPEFLSGQWLGCKKTNVFHFLLGDHTCDTGL